MVAVPGVGAFIAEGNSHTDIRRERHRMNCIDTFVVLSVSLQKHGN